MKSIAKSFGAAFCCAVFSGGTLKFLYWFAGKEQNHDAIFLTSAVFWLAGLVFVGSWFAVSSEGL